MTDRRLRVGAVNDVDLTPLSTSLPLRDASPARCQLTLSYVLNICLQLTAGLRHLHACGVLHRDLKTDNALVASLDPLTVKWADFGCSVKFARAGASTYSAGTASTTGPGLGWGGPIDADWGSTGRQVVVFASML